MKIQTYFITSLSLLIGLISFAQVKIGYNPSNIGASSLLELESDNKALLITRVNSTSLIASPVNGMLVYDISSNCIKAYQNGVWTSRWGYDPSNDVLLQIGEEGDNPNNITSTVTVAQIRSISPSITGVLIANQAAYQAYIDANPNNFSTPATAAEVQSMINSISQNALTSNGTALVAGYSCNTASAGTLIQGTAASNVSQTITANVTTVGTYNISSTANGVTFSGAGTFAGTGSQNVILTATGTPTAVTASPYSYVLNTTPSCTFTRTVINPTSNGTATIGSITSCSTTVTGIMTVGVAVSNVSQTITVDVTDAGTYSIATAAVNGVTFAATGTFTGTGSQNVVLLASGTPTAAGSNSFTINTTPNCNFSRATTVYCGALVNNVLKQFMCYNLGVTGTQDPFTYQSGLNNGSLYQWGRQTDGHEIRTSTTQIGPLAAPVANKFISDGNISPYDWRNPQNNNLWGDGTNGNNPAKAANDPCPVGFKVPSNYQWGQTHSNANGYVWTGNGFKVGTSLYLPCAGYRNNSIAEVGSAGCYWSSTVNGAYTYNLAFNSGLVSPSQNNYRVMGFSVRCISE